MLDLAQNAALQAATFGIAALGLTIAFRIVRYPDLTGDGSFMLGAAVFAALLSQGAHWSLGMAGAAVAGAGAGLMTSELHRRLGINRLLTGILTSMAAYSIAFRVLGGRANVGLLGAPTMFPGGASDVTRLAIAATFAVVIAAATWLFLRSEAGLLTRAAGANPQLLADLDRRPSAYVAGGLALANALIAGSGALVSAQQAFADVNMGLGAIILFVAAVVIGEEVVLRLSGKRAPSLLARVAAPFIGAAFYFLFYLVILRLSLLQLLPLAVHPTDLKLLSAIVVIAVLAMRRDPSRREAVVPL